MSRKYDLLHSHWILPQGFCGVLAARMMKRPHVVTVHGGDIFGLQSRPLTFLKRKVLVNADAVTVNSSVTEKAAFKVAPEMKRVYRIPMGVALEDSTHLDLVQEIRDTFRRGGGPLLVFAGRLVDEKGVEDLIRATDILSRTNPDVTAIIIGEGQDRGALEALSRSLKLSQRIFFLGWVAPELVGRYLSAADIFVGPSRQSADGWIEAQGLTIIEAMIARTPVVATRVGGIVDAVKHEETGLLINERSPDEIARSVNRLAVDKPLRERLIINAYAHASFRFSRTSSAKAFDALFKSLLTAKRLNNG